jgi:5-methylcytosine-specific restriction endonuclease McrA
MASGHDRRTAHQRGYDGRWRKERAGFLALNPWCVRLGDGCTLIAEVVDHKRPHRGDTTLFWDRANWQALCAHCHNVHKQRAEMAGPRRDHRGRLIIA